MKSSWFSVDESFLPFAAWLFKPSLIHAFFSLASALQRTIGFLAKCTCQKFLRAENAVVLSAEVF
jgi:hypothetical protein